MTEQAETISVRAMRELIAVVDGTETNFCLERDSDDTCTEFLDDLLAEFTHKISGVTCRQFHKVPGVKGLADNNLKRIYQVMFRIPFEKDGEWKGSWIGTTGVFRLEAPSTGPDASTSSHARRSTAANSSKSSRLGEVCSFQTVSDAQCSARFELALLWQASNAG